MKALVKEYPKPGLSFLILRNLGSRNLTTCCFRLSIALFAWVRPRSIDWNEWAASDKTIQLPAVLGHEASGVVVEVGSGVRQFKPGDRIVNDPMIHCGHCRHCYSGFTNMCESREIYGKRRGAFAEYAVLPERVICRLNDRLSLEEGAVLENFGIAVRSVEVEHHDAGDWAVILGGAGPIGILAAQTLVAYGVNTIITDRVDWRLNFARRYSGASVVDVREENPVRRVLELTGGKGADFVIEMGANQTVVDQAFDMVRIRGTIVTIGTFNEPISFNPFFKMTRREIKLLSVMGRNWKTWRRMNQLVDTGKINLKSLITHILPFEEYEKAFELAKSHETMKVLLKP